MQSQLIELETRLAFQDEALQTLNTVVVRQSREIAVLTREIETLKTQLRTLAATAASHEHETPPPHY